MSLATGTAICLALTACTALIVALLTIGRAIFEVAVEALTLSRAQISVVSNHALSAIRLIQARSAWMHTSKNYKNYKNYKNDKILLVLFFLKFTVGSLIGYYRRSTRFGKNTLEHPQVC